MAGIHASFNPWTVLDSNDPGDVIGKTKTKDKEDAATGKKPASGSWAPSSKAMEASTPAKKQYKKKLLAATARDQAKKKGPGAAAPQSRTARGRGLTRTIEATDALAEELAKDFPIYGDDRNLRDGYVFVACIGYS